MSINSKSKTPVIILFGPTASGKTRLVEELFHTGFEIINADSEQIYRVLSIGTAKPDKELRDRIPHHLVDWIEPEEEFSVGDFVCQADRLIGDISDRGKVPVVAGGTGFFIRQLVYGLPSAPKSDPEIRRHIRHRLETEGKTVLFEELRTLDPASADKIGPNDVYRITRALEVIALSGRPRSFFTVGTRPRDCYTFLSIGISLAREELRHRIDSRVEEMFRDGLEAEVGGLLASGYHEATPALQAIGYREFFGYLKGCLSRLELKENIKLHTRQFAKRQMTFFRRLPNTHWVGPEETEKIRLLVDDFLNKTPTA